MEYDEQEEQFVIKAKAICFPMLVHEIVKGLYEIVGTEGFGPDKEKNQVIVGAVDKLSNEPNDLRFGKFLYDAISKIYNDSDIEDARVRELFFAEVYKLDNNDFLSFVENAVNDELTPAQVSWAVGTMKESMLLLMIFVFSVFEKRLKSINLLLPLAKFVLIVMIVLRLLKVMVLFSTKK